MRFRKLLLFLIVGVLSLPLAAQAQDSDLITLNDLTPSVDVVVTLPMDTTGVVGLDLKDVVVNLIDAGGNTVFYAADQRLHSLELSIAPNVGSHTFTLERMPGVAEAYVRLRGLAQLTNYALPIPQNSSDIQLVDTTINPNRQWQDVLLTTAQPGTTIDLQLPSEQMGVISAVFTDVHATTQLVDSSGVLIASSYNGHVDGINAILDGGAYQFTVLGSDITTDLRANVRTQPIVYTALAPRVTENEAAYQIDCFATVNVNLLNLRSGPGTGYSMTGSANFGETLPVGGVNDTGGWLLVGTQDGSAWSYGGGLETSGDCSRLRVFDIPYREAPAAQVITVAQSPQVVTVPAASSGENTTAGGSSVSEYHEDDDEHEDHEQHHEDHEDEHEEDG